MVAIFKSIHSQCDNTANIRTGIAPESDSIDIVMRDPTGIVMTVTGRIVRMPDACEDTSTWPNDWEYKRSVLCGREMKPGQLDSIALK